MKYEFVRSHEKTYACQTQCRTLGISRSAYYRWRRAGSQQVKETLKDLEEKVVQTFQEHRRRYGSRRIASAIRSAGDKITRYKAGAVLKRYGLKAIQPRSFVPKTTDSRHSYAISPNLLLERPLPKKPDEVWVGDFTYIPVSGGRWIYLAVWMDLYSRRIVGWHLHDTMQETLIIRAMKMAMSNRKRSGELIVHSDRGGQYAGKQFRAMFEGKNILQSMSRADNPYDNACMESYFSRFKAELLQNGIFENIEDAKTEIFEYIEMYYNTKRIHSALNYQSPADFEKTYYVCLTQDTFVSA
jgi:transposase InsO family protein